MKEMLMKIGEIAAFFGVSPKAIRLYEKKGLLKPARVDPETGYRYYTAEQVSTLNALLDLKSLGFSLAEIRGVLDGGVDRDRLQAALARKKAAWQDAMAVAQNKVETIDDIAARIDASEQAKQLTTLTEEERAWLLVKLVCVEDLRGQSTLTQAIWL